MGLFSKNIPSIEAEAARVSLKIVTLCQETQYIPKANGNIIMIEGTIEESKFTETIFIELNTRFNNGKIIKNIILFSGMGIPFNANSNKEVLKAFALMRHNTNSRANGYWGIDRQGQKDYLNYFIDVYEDGLNNETFIASIQTILSSKKDMQKFITNNLLEF